MGGLQIDWAGEEVSTATLKGLVQREAPGGLVALAGLGWAGRGCRSGSAALAQAGRLAPGVILGSCWCDQHGHQSKAFVPEAKAASLAMLTDVDIRVVGSDSSELVVAAGALTEWNGSHPSCHSAFIKITLTCSKWPHHQVSGSAVPWLWLCEGGHGRGAVCVCFGGAGGGILERL